MQDRIKVPKNQWSEGKVHQLATLWNGDISSRTICGRQVYGETVGSEEPITCAICISTAASRS